ncbi:hypothetical protein [Streptomyces sp. VNUA24]|uniref:hypothetical protein n=1 Tax=Streptomyces sp. VNUA24 TaxID=3031131 RepID=UPI0023B7E622|nr:hypothetical protein [Streptomyces sp. VNUA24]WEH14599.1 hypothetical protein PYR72_13060 [Streptomyces sp. VNUA24]
MPSASGRSLGSRERLASGSAHWAAEFHLPGERSAGTGPGPGRDTRPDRACTGLHGACP